MPTISEPKAYRPAFVPCMRIEDHAAAIMADLAEAGIPVTPLAVLSRALDVGVPEDVAVRVAARATDATRTCRPSRL